jgi:hypothetical protein
MTIVALRRTTSLAAAPICDPEVQIQISNALSFAEDPAAFLPDGTERVASYLPALIKEAEEIMTPVGPSEVLRCLAAFAADRGISMTEDDLALDLSVEIMGLWPRDLFRQAIRSMWTSWPSHYRRLPDANAMLESIREEMERRRKRLGDLRHLALRLSNEWKQEMDRRTEEMRAYSRRTNPYSLEKLATVPDSRSSSVPQQSTRL